VRFQFGETSQTISTNVRANLEQEPDESFTVSLSEATGATLTTPMAVGTIRNDDFFPVAMLPGCCNSALIGLDTSSDDS
jgi:hypothetical protein